MKTLTMQQQHEIVGGDWGFLCGAAIGAGIGAVMISGGGALPAAMIAAEWACALTSWSSSRPGRPGSWRSPAFATQAMHQLHMAIL